MRDENKNFDIINIEDLKKFIEEKYARNLAFKTDNVEVILLCLLPGQGTPIHGHGKSDGITVILEGKISYTNLYPDGTEDSGDLEVGDIEYIPVGMQHKITNSSKEKVVMLNIYSPPLDLAGENPDLVYANNIQPNNLDLSEKTVKFLKAALASSKSANKIEINKSPLLTYNNPKRATIAIIGGGFSGTLVATHLMKKITDSPARIILIERAPRFARGFAYSTNSVHHLLNVPAGKMSAFPDIPDHFLNWAQKRDPKIQANTFVPRMLYGEYLQSVLHESELKKSPDVRFDRLNDEAVSISPLKNNKGAVIHLESGTLLPVNSIVLAVGNYPPRNPNVKEPSFYKSKKYARDPWAPNSLAGISPDDSVLMIGTGLTMVDKAVELKSRGHTGIIYAISRHGLLPQPHKVDTNQKQIDLKLDFKEPITVRNLLHTIHKKVISVANEGGDWRLVMDDMRHYVQKLWTLLPLAEKQRFFRHVRPYWDIHRHRIPPEAFAIIDSMKKTGQLEIFKGRIKKYEESSNHVEVFIKENILKVSRVINCTGSELDFCQIQDPLIVSMMEQGLIVSDKLSLGLDASINGALNDINGNTSKVLYTLGPPLKGLLWETTAVPEIREQASNLSNEIIKTVVLSKEQFFFPEVPMKELTVEDFNYII